MFGQLFPSGGGAPIPLRKERITVGRSPSCDVVVPSPKVSGRHCALRFKDGYWWVKDLDSRNGTGINGKKISVAQLLPGHILCVPGKRFRIKYPDPSGDGQNMSDDSMAMRALGSGTSDDSTSDSQEMPIAEGHATGLATAEPPPEKAPVEESHPAPKPKPAAAPEDGRKRYLGKLTPVGGGVPVPLMESAIIIGRSRSAGIRIKMATVSSRHCSLTLEDGYWWIEDLGSSNGIRVNGEKVDRRCLMPGDKISVSKNRFVIDYTPEGEPPRDPGLFKKSLLEKAGLQNVLESDDAPAWITSHEAKDEDSRTKYRLDDSDPD